jgi:hypothetical protein
MELSTPKEAPMTSSLTERFRSSSPGEQERALILGARLLVKQARILGHDVDPEIAARAGRTLPEDQPKAS